MLCDKGAELQQMACLATLKKTDVKDKRTLQCSSLIDHSQPSKQSRLEAEHSCFIVRNPRLLSKRTHPHVHSAQLARKQHSSKPAAQNTDMEMIPASRRCSKCTRQQLHLCAGAGCAA